MKSVLFVVIFALVLIAGGAFIYLSTQNSKMVPPTYIEPTSLPMDITASPSATPIVMSSPSAETKKLYVSKRFQIKFDYPDRYIVDASRESSNSAYGYIYLYLKEDYEWMTASPAPGRGGPTNFIRVAGFSNPKKLTPVQWAKANINESNYPGSHTIEKIAGEDALSYTFEGMGIGTSRIFSHGDFIYSIDGLVNSDQTKEDYKLLLKSISFVE
jgi:hypothetical protein